MSILIVPTNYSTLQAAIDASNPGDEIYILPDTTLYENIQIVNKENISIVAIPKTVIVSGLNTGGTAAFIQSNNITIKGLMFEKFTEGLEILGNNNKMITVTTKNNNRSGMLIRGDYNQIITCIAQSNTSTGIDLEGNYNQVVATRLEGSKRGITATNGSVMGNVFYKNIILNNSEFGVRIAAPKAENNVFKENTVVGSINGLICNFGRIAFIGNYITDNSNTGIIYKDNRGLILENTLINNYIGMYLESCGSLIADNTVQTGGSTGVLVMGSHDTVINNVVTSYSGTGLLVSGNKNSICNNITQLNGVNEIINGNCNDVKCSCKYNASLACKGVRDDNYLSLLNVFEKPDDYYYKCSKCAK